MITFQQIRNATIKLQYASVSFMIDPWLMNACDARTRAGGRLIMDAADVKMTCDCRLESIVIASHMDTVSHAYLTRAQLRDVLAGTRYDAQVLIPEDGE